VRERCAAPELHQLARDGRAVQEVQVRGGDVVVQVRLIPAPPRAASAPVSGSLPAGRPGRGHGARAHVSNLSAASPVDSRSASSSISR